MKIRTYSRSALLLLPLLMAIPALAQGDKVLAQVANGTGSDGTQFITKFRITNLGPIQDTEIKNLTVLFFHQDGTAWSLQTSLGTNSQFPLDIGSYQTLAIDTSGTGDLTSGYAIVRNTDGQTIYAEDYQAAVTVFYEVRKGGLVTDTISVPVSQPTRSFVLPVEIDNSSSLYTGFAIVNLAGVANGITLQLYQSTSPSSGEAPSAATQQITLGPNEQRATFLYPSIFPNASTFKGTLVAIAEQPVAVLALLQTPTAAGPQYTTMVPAFIDALRRNSYIYLREGNALDADRLIVDYFFDQDLIKDPNYYEPDVDLPWDVLYERISDTARQLTAQKGAQFAVIGAKTSTDFDNLTIRDLQALSYSGAAIDMSDGSSHLTLDATLGNFAFAIKTGLGRYAKARVADVITAGTDRDLALEVFVFK
jgi:hypothetical protein